MRRPVRRYVMGWAWLALMVAGAPSIAGDIVRVLSVESPQRVLIVDARGGTRAVALAGVPAADAATGLEQTQHLRDALLSRVVRVEPVTSGANSPVRLWLGEQDVATLLHVDNPEVPVRPPVTTQITAAAPAKPVSVALAVPPAAQPIEHVSPASPAPEVDAASTDTAVLVIADRREGLYHVSGCPGFARIAARDRVRFSSTAAAEAEGFRRAGNCPAVP